MRKRRKSKASTKQVIECFIEWLKDFKKK